MKTVSPSPQNRKHWIFFFPSQHNTKVEKIPLVLLLGDTDSPSTATGGLGVLTTHAEAPVVTETTVSADLLEALEVVAQLGVDAVGEDLVVLAVDNVALPVEEPGRDLVLRRVLDDGDDALEFFRGEFTGAAWVMSVHGVRPVVHNLVLAYRLFRSTSAFLQTKLE